MPVVAGLGTDVAGARAAILLAEKLRGAYDHMHSARIFADLDVMRQAGLMFTTPQAKQACRLSALHSCLLPAPPRMSVSIVATLGMRMPSAPMQAHGYVMPQRLQAAD